MKMVRNVDDMRMEGENMKVIGKMVNQMEKVCGLMKNVIRNMKVNGRMV